MNTGYLAACMHLLLHILYVLTCLAVYLMLVHLQTGVPGSILVYGVIVTVGYSLMMLLGF
jgi:hypothetical protein